MITIWHHKHNISKFHVFFSHFCMCTITLDIQPPRRPLGFRAGVHKSESAKEMLLSQHMFGALPPSPPESSADVSFNLLCETSTAKIDSPLVRFPSTTYHFFAMIQLIFVSCAFCFSRKLMVFHHCRRCQPKAMPIFMRQKFDPTAIDQHHWAKNTKADIVIQSKVHRPFHRIDAHPPKIRLKQCKKCIFKHSSRLCGTI